MSKARARTIVCTGCLGLLLAVMGGLARIEIVMWTGIALYGILGILAVIERLTGLHTFPTDDEIW